MRARSFLTRGSLSPRAAAAAGVDAIGGLRGGRNLRSRHHGGGFLFLARLFAGPQTGRAQRLVGDGDLDQHDRADHHRDPLRSNERDRRCPGRAEEQLDLDGAQAILDEC